MRSRQAFTLVELLVVVAIIAMLATILTVAIARIFETSRRVGCAAAVSGICKAFSLHKEENEDRMASPTTWPVEIGKYLAVKPSDASAIDPSLEDIARSKVMMCPSALVLFGKKTTNTLHIAFARNHEFDPNGDKKIDDSPYYLNLVSPSKTMLALDAPYRSPSIGWGLQAKFVPDYVPEAPVYDTHKGDGLNVGFVDGRAVWMDAKEMPGDPANTNIVRRTSVYFNGTFWMGAPE